MLQFEDDEALLGCIVVKLIDDELLFVGEEGSLLDDGMSFCDGLVFISNYEDMSFDTSFLIPDNVASLL